MNRHNKQHNSILPVCLPSAHQACLLLSSAVAANHRNLIKPKAGYICRVLTDNKGSSLQMPSRSQPHSFIHGHSNHNKQHKAASNTLTYVLPFNPCLTCMQTEHGPHPYPSSQITLPLCSASDVAPMLTSRTHAQVLQSSFRLAWHTHGLRTHPHPRTNTHTRARTHAHSHMRGACRTHRHRTAAYHVCHTMACCAVNHLLDCA